MTTSVVCRRMDGKIPLLRPSRLEPLQFALASSDTDQRLDFVKDRSVRMDKMSIVMDWPGGDQDRKV
jgi:hypothetical protein